MTPEWKAAIDSFVDMFSNLDFHNGPLFYLVGIAAAGYCCMEGYRIYKMILGGLGFVFGFRVGHMIFSGLSWTGEKLLMAEVFCGLILMVLAYKIYLAGIFIAAFQFCLVNLPVYINSLVGDKMEEGTILRNVVVTIISVIAALVAARLSVKLSRPVIVCLTAVIGGFAMINYFLMLIPVFPYQLSLPPENSIIWLAAKVFLSAAGVGIQGTKDPLGSV